MYDWFYTKLDKFIINRHILYRSYYIHIPLYIFLYKFTSTIIDIKIRKTTEMDLSYFRIPFFGIKLSYILIYPIRQIPIFQGLRSTEIYVTPSPIYHIPIFYLPPQFTTFLPELLPNSKYLWKQVSYWHIVLYWNRVRIKLLRGTPLSKKRWTGRKAVVSKRESRDDVRATSPVLCDIASQIVLAHAVIARHSCECEVLSWAW